MIKPPTPWRVEILTDDYRVHYLFFAEEENARAWQAAQDANDESEDPMPNRLFWNTMMATLGMTYGEDIILATLKNPVD